MKTVRLYGVLAKKFGKEFRLNVKSPAEAIRALCLQIKGFRQHIQEFSEPGYVIRVGKGDRDVDTLVGPCSDKEVIKIIPALAGGNATVRIVIGAILVAVALLPGPHSPVLGAMGLTMIGSVGASLVIGGIAELLAPSPPKMEQAKRPEETPSYLFNGPVNTVGTGYAVPVGYGTLLIGSHVISAELYSVEEPITS